MRYAALRWLSIVLIAGTLTSAALAEEPEHGFGGGGSGLGLFMPDLSEINAFVEGAGFPTLDGNLFLVGGGGRGGVVPGPVFGGSGWGAWIESENANLHAEYGLGLGGFELGFAIGGNERSVLSIGAVMGGGGVELILTEYPPIVLEGSTPRGIVVEPTRHVYDSGFAFVDPYVDMQIHLLAWMGLGLRAGYVLPLFELNWRDEGPLDAPPLAPSGLYVRLSVVFGGFGLMDSEATVDEEPIP